MRRVVIVFLISLAAFAMANSGFIAPQSSYAEGDLYINATLDSEKEKAIGIASEKGKVISIAKEICDREKLSWEDVAIRSLGEGRWRITITSFEQGRTLTLEIDAGSGIILSKSFK